MAVHDLGVILDLEISFSCIASVALLPAATSRRVHSTAPALPTPSPRLELHPTLSPAATPMRSLCPKSTPIPTRGTWCLCGWSSWGAGGPKCPWASQCCPGHATAAHPAANLQQQTPLPCMVLCTKPSPREQTQRAASPGDISCGPPSPATSPSPKPNPGSPQQDREGGGSATRPGKAEAVPLDWGRRWRCHHQPVLPPTSTASRCHVPQQSQLPLRPAEGFGHSPTSRWQLSRSPLSPCMGCPLSTSHGANAGDQDPPPGDTWPWRDGEGRASCWDGGLL